MRYFVFLIALFCTIPAFATTWYVRPDGGTRYSTNQPTGQCNGQYNAPYPGSGVNQNCAFGDVRYLWADGSYANGSTFPAWGWVGTSGDTYLINCPTDCRVGYSGPDNTTGSRFLGIAGNPYGSGAPPPHNGTAGAHTRILGSNYANCSSDSAKAHINGGHGISQVFNFKGSSYVEMACFDITDHSSCGRASQSTSCHTNYPLDDYSTNGIATNNMTTNVAITDVRIHGMGLNGMVGATGPGVTLQRVALVANPSSGWNMDDGSGTTGTGSLNLDHVSVLWNGCAEEYPIVDSLPYQDCRDDNSGGYGDGIGTASITSNPAWIVKVINSTAAYNTQDGFDLLHLQGGGSSLTITQSLAYGNMGQQLKVGSASVVRNNLLVGNCNALRLPIPGTPSGYNSKLSDFCRAADTAVLVKVQDSVQTYFQFNTLYAANATGLEIDCNGICTDLSTIAYENNVFVGFANNTADGYPNGGNRAYSNPVYLSVHGLFSNPGSVFSHNATYHPKSNWVCPSTYYNESDAECDDPQLTDETWHLYGYGDMSPIQNSRVIGIGMAIPGMNGDNKGMTRPNPPSIGALEYGPDLSAMSINVEVSPSPSIANHVVTLRATAGNRNGAMPTGTVAFLNGGTPLGTASLDNISTATFDLPGLPAGSYGIIANYSGDSKYPPTESGVTTLAVLAPTTISLAASPSSATISSTISLTATVKASDAIVPAGTVTFMNGSAAIGTATVNASGVAVFSTRALSVGSHSLVAKYSGNGTSFASTSPAITVTVMAQTTTTSLAASPSSAITGSTISLTATVKASGAVVPAGTVTFMNGSAAIGTATVNASGVAVLSTRALSVGSHSLVAKYSGNGSSLASTSTALTVKVTK